VKKDVQSRLKQKMTFLKEVKLFSGFSDRQLDSMLPVMDLMEFEAGDIIIKEGDSDETVYILLEGEVEVSKTLVLPEWIKASQQQEKSLTRLSHHHHLFFGEMAMLEDKPERSATIRAMKSCLMVTLSREDIEAMVAKDPQIGMLIYRNIARELVERLVRANKDILKLTTAFTLALEG
jgi:CRP-like cAMP-binding protein